MDVLPSKKDEVLFQDVLDLLFSKMPSDRPAVRVINDTARLIEHLPTPLPGKIAEVCVL